jgi:hypothetical protein
MRCGCQVDKQRGQILKNEDKRKVNKIFLTNFFTNPSEI